MRQGRASKQEILFEGELAKKLGQHPVNLAAQGDVVVSLSFIIGVGFTQDQPRSRKVPVGEGLAQFGQQKHRLGVLEITLGGIVALDHPQLADTLGIEISGEMTGLAGQPQQAPFVAASRFTQDTQAGQTVLEGQSFKMLQGLENGQIAIGNGLLDTVSGVGCQGQFGVGVERLLADIESDLEQIGIDGIEFGGSFHIVNLVWGMGITIVEATRLTTPVSVADTPFHFPFARPNSRCRQLRYTTSRAGSGMAASAVAALWRDKPVPLRGSRLLVPRG